jgi:hypothetical protein
MFLTVTFRDRAEQECRNYEQRYSSFSESEAESLPHFIEVETPGLFNQSKSIQTGVMKCLTDYKDVL